MYWKNINLLIILILVVFFITYIVSIINVFAINISKATIIRIGATWIKVKAELPSNTLKANKVYNLTITFRIIESESWDFTFHVKAIRVVIGNKYVEYVPDFPIEFYGSKIKKYPKVNEYRQATVNISLEPSIYASGLEPGDIVRQDMRIEFAYYYYYCYYETTKEGKLQKKCEAKAGIYTLFASIPITIIVPKTFLSVEPQVVEIYEPHYIIKFLVKVKVFGEGCVENVKVHFTGVPVRTYLLTTGMLCSGEEKVLETYMNVSKLGEFAPKEATITINVQAKTLWGYVYKYTFKRSLKLKEIRTLTLSIPNKVIVSAYTPISISLIPEPPKDEKVYFEFYANGKQIWKGAYTKNLFLILSNTEGIVKGKVISYSNKQIKITKEFKVESIIVKPKIYAALTGQKVLITIIPVIPGSISFEIIDVKGIKKYSTIISKLIEPGITGIIENIITSKGTYTLTLPPLSDCKNCIAIIKYNSKLGVSEYRLAIPEAVLKQTQQTLLSPITQQLLIIIIVIICISIGLSLFFIIRKRRKGKKELLTEFSEEELTKTETI